MIKLLPLFNSSYACYARSRFAGPLERMALQIILYPTVRKKVESKTAPLENGALLEGGAVFFLNNHVLK